VVKERVMASLDPTAATTWKRHPILPAWLPASALPWTPRRGRAPSRLLAGLAGRVLEIGAGNGRNFPHYPPAVTEVLAVEPELEGDQMGR
jgi:hypothetical protein